MAEHTRVLVIGGGIVGCSVLYHLTKPGWTDVTLVERRDLTHGATWHAAGNTHTHSVVQNICRLQAYSLDLYRRLEEETGQKVGMHTVGGFFLATREERIDEFKYFVSRYRNLGLDYRLADLDEVREKHPLVDTDGLIGAMWDPEEGYIDPYSVTQALAQGARNGGARIVRNSAVLDIEALPGNRWRVITETGDWVADYIVNAAGYWAPEVARMTGGNLPLVNMEHHYLVTEEIGDIAGLRFELPMIREVDAEYYLRQEGKGLLAGVWEKQATPWGLDGVPKSFGQELLPDDMGRIEDHLMRVVERVPAFGEGGIKSIINGAICFSPDSRPVIGPMPGQPTHFAAAGFLGGITQAGGFGKAVTDWMVKGQPDLDLFDVDVARYGDFATKAWAVERVKDVFPRRYAIVYPFEERMAGRPVKTTPLYTALKDRGAVFGSAYGWERALWYAPEGMEPVDELSFRRANWFGPVGDECRAARDAAGIIEMSTFAKFEVGGPGAEAFLERVLANKVPKTAGRIVLTPFLNKLGGIVGEFTIIRRDDGSFYLIGASVAETHYRRWLEAHAPEDGVSIRSLSAGTGILGLVGPHSRDILQEIANADVSNDALPFLRAQNFEVGPAPSFVLRVSYVGDLGYEIHHPMEYQVALYQALARAGGKYGMKPVGSRAMDSMRIEKDYRRWGAELRTEYTPFVAGLDRFVSLDKGDFIGRDALLEAGSEPEKRIATLVIDADDADAVANEAVYLGDDLVGVVTSGTYGHRTGNSVAMACLPTELTKAGTEFAVEILGDRRPAVVAGEPLFDPTNERLRS